MTRPRERVHHGSSATTLGPDPADPSRAISLPEAAFGNGTYVEGDDPGLQGALLDSWCVQWAEAGYGFCYVHPGGSAPRELLARLPAERLDDVVWIDVDRSRLAERLRVPIQTQVTVDAFDAPEPDPDTYERDPVNARVNAYLDAFSEHPEFDWNVARVLSSVLPALFLRDDVDPSNVGKALESRGLDALSESLADAAGDLDEETRQALAAARRASAGALDRADDPAGDAAWLLHQLSEPNPDDLLVGEGSYDVGRALLEDDIVVVSGAAVEPDEARWRSDLDRLRTHLLVAALCCRLQEAAAFAPPGSQMFPVVLDGLEDLIAGEGDVFQQMLRTSHEVPLAPVFSGPRPSDLPESLRLAVGDHVATRIVVTDEEHPEPEPDFDPASEPYLTSALGLGSMGVVDDYLARAGLSALPEAPLSWCRVNATDRSADRRTVQECIQPAIVPRRPERRRPPNEVAAVIARSVDRLG